MKDVFAVHYFSAKANPDTESGEIAIYVFKKEWRLKIQVVTVVYSILLYDLLSAGVGIYASMHDTEME